MFPFIFVSDFDVTFYVTRKWHGCGEGLFCQALRYAK